MAFQLNLAVKWPRHCKWRQEPAPPPTTTTTPVPAASEEKGLGLATFNLLAPPYRRLRSPRTPSAEPTRESRFDGVWRRRAADTVDFIAEELGESEVICLQEYWFEEEYDEMFRQRFEDNYVFHRRKRTGDKTDGLVVLLRRGHFDVLGRKDVSLCQEGDRVALLLHLRTRPSEDADLTAGEGGGAEMILVNTHLAFPHDATRRAGQVQQVERILAAIESYAKDTNLQSSEISTVLVGDLNADNSDPVCARLREAGFRGAWETPSRQPVVSHRNHRGEDVLADHVFVRGRQGALPGSGGGDVAAAAGRNFGVKEAVLMPRQCDESRWSDGFRLSDHRPLLVKLG